MGASRIDELRCDIKLLKRMLLLLWSKKLIYVKYISVAVVLALVIVLSVPAKYSSSAILVPENYPTGANAGIISLAGMLGVNMGHLTKDAYSTDMYPMIVASSNFLTKMGGVNVKVPTAGIDTTYSAHLIKNKKIAWWSYPAYWAKKMLSQESSAIQDHSANDIIRNNVRVDIDKIRGVILVSVYDYEPLVCKQIADSVIHNLNAFVQEYRTKKAASDYNAMATLADSLRANYFDVQEKYKDYVEAAPKVPDAVFKQQCAFLKGEAELAYSAYMQMMSQAQSAKVKLLESVPIYNIIESPVTPQSPCSPPKFIIFMLFVAMAVVVASVKILCTEVLYKR